jgi:hypothetical protein
MNEVGGSGKVQSRILLQDHGKERCLRCILGIEITEFFDGLDMGAGKPRRKG